MSAPVPFERTLASLRADRSVRSGVLVAVALALFVPWALWLSLARVQVLESSSNARIERPHYEINSEVAGRLHSASVQLTRSVDKGELLAQVDDTAIRAQLLAARTKAEALDAELRAKRSEADSLAASAKLLPALSAAAKQEAKARTKAARSAAGLAHTQSKRVRKLYESGVVGREERQRAAAQAAELSHQRVASGHLESRLAYEFARTRTQAEADHERALAEATRLQGSLAVANAELDGLRRELSRYSIVAPASGEIAETLSRRAGEFVNPGDKLGTLVSDEGAVVVAHFSPRAAAGRVHEGQQGLLFLDGFPWPRFDPIPVEVTAVSKETSDGLLRVELAIGAESSHLAHGLEGRVDLVIEEASPVDFILRALGERVNDAVRPSR